MQTSEIQCTTSRNLVWLRPCFRLTYWVLLKHPEWFIKSSFGP